MGSFIGGSAYAMASQISEGYILLNPAMLRKFSPAELNLLEAEIDKIAREVRAENPPLDDIPALQKRNRKLARINQANLMIKTNRSQRRI